jgi:hypothetical protein
MRGKSIPRPVIDFHHGRFTQISESHCGPAVIQMQLSNLGIEVTQEAVTEAGGAKDAIALHGMRVDQMARAVRVLAPRTCFWYKDHTSIDELVRVVQEFKTIAGVEWQGLFEDKLEDETVDGDYGHYSAVTAADTFNRQLIIADPYKDFRSADRVFTFEFFMSRWWDVNDVADPATGLEQPVEDRQMMFIITPMRATFPRLLGLNRGW